VLLLASFVSSFPLTGFQMLRPHSKGCAAGSFCVGIDTCCWDDQIACGEGKRNTPIRGRATYMS
jgi:hypothetical protein